MELSKKSSPKQVQQTDSFCLSRPFQLFSLLLKNTGECCFCQTEGKHALGKSEQAVDFHENSSLHYLEISSACSWGGKKSEISGHNFPLVNDQLVEMVSTQIRVCPWVKENYTPTGLIMNTNISQFYQLQNEDTNFLALSRELFLRIKSEHLCERAY